MYSAHSFPSTWVRFTRLDGPRELAQDEVIDRLTIESVTNVRGAPLEGLEPGDSFARIESSVAIPGGSGDLVAVTQHLGYTRAVERAEIAAATSPGADAHVVVIPITKSVAWWELAHDERDQLFRGAGSAEGHVGVGRPVARKILRKLYHGRGLPGAGWDFLTYFEFARELAAEFRALVARLRDPAQNPEWWHVEREAEIWLTRAG